MLCDRYHNNWRRRWTRRRRRTSRMFKFRKARAQFHRRSFTVRLHFHILKPAMEFFSSSRLLPRDESLIFLDISKEITFNGISSRFLFVHKETSRETEKAKRDKRKTWKDKYSISVRFIVIKFFSFFVNHSHIYCNNYI